MSERPGKQKYAAEVTDGEGVDDLFLLKTFEVKQKKDGSPYIWAEIADVTGTLSCFIWGVQGYGDTVMEIASSLRPGEVYQVRGFAKIYNGSVQVSVNEGIAALAEPVSPALVDPNDYVSSPVKDLDLKGGVLRMAGEITDPVLGQMVLEAISSVDGFFIKPAAKGRHHEYRGGLAEHTLETARIALAACEAGRTDADRDLVIAGALLHDIGKAFCFEEQGLGFAAQPEYDLVGHVTLGVSYIAPIAKKRLPAGKAAHLLHILQAHHGPHGEVPCQTPEAWTVHLADLTSATLREAADDQADLVPGSGKRNGWRSGGPVWRFE
ncbi:HD domain-containing protein [Methanofollis formosanus]|uniref:HD domain-containing protein n=1 Tax=Methanofollis formosanus TaxID=299308 RepID=A0A8G1A102_9EURY|nr:HD domain-containing protein [Methanofollis formosanus]QYZ78550.1 HD domain-containing protein [Methanofollis formosanus]